MVSGSLCDNLRLAIALAEHVFFGARAVFKLLKYNTYSASKWLWVEEKVTNSVISTFQPFCFNQIITNLNNFNLKEGFIRSVYTSNFKNFGSKSISKHDIADIGITTVEIFVYSRRNVVVQTRSVSLTEKYQLSLTHLKIQCELSKRRILFTVQTVL